MQLIVLHEMHNITTNQYFEAIGMSLYHIIMYNYKAYL